MWTTLQKWVKLRGGGACSRPLLLGMHPPLWPLGLYPALISLSILNPLLCTLCTHPRPYSTCNRGCKLLLVLAPLSLECPRPRPYRTSKDLCQCFQCRVKPKWEGFTGIKALWGRAACRSNSCPPRALSYLSWMTIWSNLSFSFTKRPFLVRYDAECLLSINSRAFHFWSLHLDIRTRYKISVLSVSNIILDILFM
jgi:hypothetical protein